MAKTDPKPQLIPVTTLALVKRDGGLSLLKVKLLCSPDLSVVEVVGGEMGKADYRAIVASKAAVELAKSPAWAVAP